MLALAVPSDLRHARRHLPGRRPPYTYTYTYTV